MGLQLLRNSLYTFFDGKTSIFKRYFTFRSSSLQCEPFTMEQLNEELLGGICPEESHSLVAVKGRTHFHANAKWQAEKRKNSNPRQKSSRWEIHFSYVKNESRTRHVYTPFLQEATTWGSLLLVVMTTERSSCRFYPTLYILKLSKHPIR